MNYAGYSDGGFEHNSTGNNGNNHSDFGNGDSNKPRYASQFITPVTIKMINDATLVTDHEPAFYSHGVELSYVRFIGVLRGIDNQATHKMLTLEDGTGSIQVRLWNNEKGAGAGMDDDMGGDMDDMNDDSDDGDVSGEKLRISKYVDIVATIKDFNSKAQIQVQNISVIKDFNTVTYHLLNVAKNYLVQKNDNGASATSASSAGAGESLFVDNGDASRTENKPLPEVLIEFILEHSKSMPDGVPVNFMASTLELSETDVQNAVSELHQDGRIFSTDDDDSYLPL